MTLITIFKQQHELALISVQCGAPTDFPSVASYKYGGKQQYQKQLQSSVAFLKFTAF